MAATPTMTRRIDAALDGWKPPPRPKFTPMQGRYVTLVPLLPVHAKQLYAANRHDSENRNWAYLPYGPFADLAAYRGWVESIAQRQETMFFTVCHKADGNPVGIASYLNINPEMGSIEVGHIHFSPLLQASRAATEALVLMMENAFSLGYRRYEWKCNALNLASRRAAQRLGMSYEGVFRQHMVVKSRNRDTAWLSILDGEWTAARETFAIWLHPDNFDKNGKQKQSLSVLTKPLLAAIDPLLATA